MPTPVSDAPFGEDHDARRGGDFAAPPGARRLATLGAPPGGGWMPSTGSDALFGEDHDDRSASDFAHPPRQSFHSRLVAENGPRRRPRVGPIRLRVAHLLRIFRRKIGHLKSLHGPVLIWRWRNVLVPFLAPPIRDATARVTSPTFNVAPAPFSCGIDCVNGIASDVRVHIPRLRLVPIPVFAWVER